MKEELRLRACSWVVGNDTGLSSNNMWAVFMGVPIKDIYWIYHPSDPSDFGRCYRLLQLIPEWKQRIIELKPLSKEWSALVDNWEELCNMYDQNEKEKWVNKHEIGMFQFMEKLTN